MQRLNRVVWRKIQMWNDGQGCGCIGEEKYEVRRVDALPKNERNSKYYTHDIPRVEGMDF